jgi:putative phosphonate metabolism protein
MTMLDKTSSPYRVAVYFAPQVQSALWLAGSRWLGRCAWTGEPYPQRPLQALSAESLRAVTAEPRRYGWHATLKAPFRLAQGSSLGHLKQAVQTLCSRTRAFDIAPLQVTRMGNFLALRPADESEALACLAADCVRELQALAAPLDQAELARRRATPLTPEQEANLVTWGYPWVMEFFRFHLSLTGPLHDLTAAQQASLQAAAECHFQDVPQGRIDALSIFVEPQRGAPFRLVEQIGFAQ